MAARSADPGARSAARAGRRGAAAAAWPAGEGETAALVRERDWGKTALGPAALWSPAWRSAVDLVLGSPAAMALEWGVDGVLIYNDAYARFAPTRHPAALGCTVGEVWPQFEGFSRAHRVAALGGAHRSFRGLQVMTDTGLGEEPLWLDLQYSPVRDEGGAPIAALVVVADSTERARTEQRRAVLFDLAERLRTAHASSEMVGAAAELIGPALSAARAGYARMEAEGSFGMVERDWTDGTAASIVGRHDLRAFGEGIEATLRTGAPVILTDVERDPRAADGLAAYEAMGVRASLNLPLMRDGRLATLFYVHSAAPRNWSAAEIALAQEVADRTWEAVERARAEDELRAINRELERRVARALAERQLWADIFENTGDPVAAVDKNFRLLAANKAYRDELARLFDANVDIGVSLAEALRHLPQIRETSLAAWREALAGRTVEATGIGRQDGDGPFYDIRFQPLRNREGRQVGAFQHSREATARVIAERRLRETQEQLRQSQKMEAVGQLTGGIAHDFNNLLQGILGSLSLVQKRLESGRTADVQRFIAGAETSANRAAALTHRLLAFSRRQPLDPKAVKANALVASMEDLLRRTLGEHIALELVLAGGLWQTLCDPNQLESALLNLAINARDAMPDGGKLTVETCNAHLDDRYAARARDVAPGQYVCLCVTDTGGGMTPEVLERAFEPFFTTKPIGQGTGLGLSMIYGFARQSEGYAKLYSEPGKGTTVKLYLPRHRGPDEAAVDEAHHFTDAQHAEAGEVVLVVEDEPVVRGLIVEVLDELGYRALEAADGPTGLQLLRDRRRRIDLLITDIGLPGLNGRQLVDAAREQRPDLRVLFMTGYAENAALASGFLDPGMAMITKPFAMDHLATRIREMIAAG